MNLLNRISLAALFAILAAGLHGCGSSSETEKTSTTETPAVVTKEMLYQRGHLFYLQQNLDSAHAALQQAYLLDNQYQDVLKDLAPLQYDLAFRVQGTKRKNDLLRKSREYYMKLEAAGAKESETYERICEISNTLNDDKTFLVYAKKNLEMFPYERQYYNLSVAYANIEDWNSLINSMKKAVDKFPGSSYIGSFYRQLGRAYMKVGRDQTAEKIFYTGIKAVDDKLTNLRRSVPPKESGDLSRLKDDKIGMLISLKNLHTTYRATDKLADVEKKLKELGK